MVEEWRDVVGYEGVYAVSSVGRVKRVAGGRGSTPGRILKPFDPTGKYGYRSVTLSRSNVQTIRPVHRLVAEAFIGTPSGEVEINHRNGNPSDNRPENLEWVSHRANMHHAIYELGTVGPPPVKRGESHHESKLKREQVLRIREMAAMRDDAGRRLHSNVKIAAAFGVSDVLVSLIVRRRAWTHV